MGVYAALVRFGRLGTFSLAEELEIWKPGDPGVQTGGFQNTGGYDNLSFSQVIELARSEVTVSYDQLSVCYDWATEAWMVHFYTSGTLGGDQSIFLDKSGATLLRVAGE